MPGTIIRVAVKTGDAVKRGDTLLVLEAMKMENEIQTPTDGTVAQVAVAQGASVDTGALLAVIS
jgi:glutaconyl-CoA decarboxylase